MKVLVYGSGVSGRAVEKFYKRQGMDVVVLDDSMPKPSMDFFTQFSLFSPSPGVPRSHWVYQKMQTLGVEIAGELELALRVLCQKRKEGLGEKIFCIGITGTNGKSTLCAQIAHVFQVLGYRASVVGNFGEPFLQAVYQPLDVFVVECSSFQLETMVTPAFSFAGLLPITEDHLDRYKDFQEYHDIKTSIQKLVIKGGGFICGDATAILEKCSSHFHLPMQGVQEALASFVSLPHRMQKVHESNGVVYINDSKATNVASVCFALQKCFSPVVLLLGGVYKGGDFASLIPWMHMVKYVVIFGKDQELIRGQLKDGVDRVYCVDSLENAFEFAHKILVPGDILLLSPGCSSFDQFKNYEQRGDVFTCLAKNLEQEI